MGIVTFGTCAFSIESDFKNSLLKVDLVKYGSNDYNVKLYTQKPYSEPVKVIKKTNTSYYMLLPETFHSVGSVSPVGDIKNVEVKLFPYAGQDLNNGYTKITIYTTKPVNISPKISTASGSVAPSVDTKKLAQLDSAFNTKQAQIQAKQRQAQYEANQKQIQQQKALEAQKKAQQIEAQKKAQQIEAQRKAQLEAQKRAQEEAQRKAQELKAAQERNAQMEAQKKAQAEAQRKAQLEAQKRAQEEAQRKAQLEAQKKAQLEAQKREQEEKPRQEKASQQQAAKIQQKTTPVTQKAPSAKPIATVEEIQTEHTDIINKEIKQPQEEQKELNENIVTEDITNAPEINESANMTDSIEEQNTKVSFIEILKDKLSPLKPYYYIIIDNPILVIASLVAFIGIIMLVILNKNQKKGLLKNMNEDKTTADTEKIDLEALGEVDTTTNPLIQNDKNDEIQSFADVTDNLSNSDNPEYEIQQSETAVKSLEEEEPYIEPEVLSSVEIAPNRGFMVIERQGVKALFGYINEDVFLLYQFREYLSDSSIKFRISEKQEDKTFFIVKVDKFKLLIRVTNVSMRLELEM